MPSPAPVPTATPTPTPTSHAHQQRLIVGIDYGTSNSGVAYALFDADDECDKVDINVISSWPQAATSHYSTSEKVPSDVAYDSDKQAVGFGFDIPSDTQTLQWVKLLLEPDDLTKKSEQNAARVWKSYHALDSKHLDKSPVDAVADYLRWLWDTVKDKIQEEEDDEELFDTAKLTVVLTVPASWSERAKDSMARAAKAAGIPEKTLKLVAEPEAAAIHSLKKLAGKKKAKREVEAGDCVIVCDAGGGTVDVVAYQVHTHDPLSLDQVTVCRGDFCGSAFIDSEFHSQIRSILGPDYDTLDDEVKARIEEEFEYKIKRTYDPLKPRKFYIPVTDLPDDEDRGIARGKMLVDEAVLSTAFESVMTPIMSLIDSQIAALREKGLEDKLKGILLVGGFSGSEFLHNRIREEFPGKNDIKVWRPDKTWTAVVQGAVACEAYGNSRTAVVHTRLSSYNYGIPYRAKSGRKVQWLVRKGEPVKTDQMTEPYGLRIDDEDWLDEDEFCHLMVPLVRSEEDRPSDDYGPLVTPHAEIDCRVPTSLRHSPQAKLIQELPKKAWHIPATLVLFLDGAVISFRCRIQDQDVGVADVTYFPEEIQEQDLRRTSTLTFPSDSSRSSFETRASKDTNPSSSHSRELDLATTATSTTDSSAAKGSRKPSLKSVINASFFTIQTRRDPAKVKEPKVKKEKDYVYVPFGLYGRQKVYIDPARRNSASSTVRAMQRRDSSQATSPPDGRSLRDPPRKGSASSASTGSQSLASPSLASPGHASPTDTGMSPWLGNKRASMPCTPEIEEPEEIGPALTMFRPSFSGFGKLSE